MSAFHYSKIELIQDLQKVAKRVGHPPRVKEYDKFGKATYATIIYRFKSWNNALKEAGFKLEKGQGRYTTEELLEDLRRVSLLLDHPPRRKDYDRLGRATSDAIQRRFGWIAALKNIGITPDTKQLAPLGYTEEQLIEEYVKAYSLLGRAPKQEEFGTIVKYNWHSYHTHFRTMEALARKTGRNLYREQFPPLSFEQEQIVIGSLLGDGYLIGDRGQKWLSCSFGILHSKKQEEWALWKMRHFESMKSNWWGIKSQYFDRRPQADKTYTRVEFKTRSTQRFNVYHEGVYREGKKSEFPTDFLWKLEPLGLAIWYGDDGNLRIPSKKRRGYSIRLATSCFSEESVKNMQVAFLKKFGIKVNITVHQKKKVLDIYGWKNVKKFLDLVRPYLSQVSCLSYKLASPRNHNLDRRKPKKIYVCLHCKSKFERPIWEPRSFCSRSCYELAAKLKHFASK